MLNQKLNKLQRANSSPNMQTHNKKQKQTSEDEEKHISNFLFDGDDFDYESNVVSNPQPNVEPNVEPNVDIKQDDQQTSLISTILKQNYNSVAKYDAYDNEYRFYEFCSNDDTIMYVEAFLNADTLFLSKEPAPDKTKLAKKYRSMLGSAWLNQAEKISKLILDHCIKHSIEIKIDMTNRSDMRAIASSVSAIEWLCGTGYDFRANDDELFREACLQHHYSVAKWLMDRCPDYYALFGGDQDSKYRSCIDYCLTTDAAVHCLLDRYADGIYLKHIP